MESSIRTPLLAEEQKKIEVKTRLIDQGLCNKQEKVVKCSYCAQNLSYLDDCFCIRCPKCFGITAVQELLTMVCCKCSNNIVFPKNSPTIQCICGQIYAANT